MSEPSRWAQRPGRRAPAAPSGGQGRTQPIPQHPTRPIGAPGSFGPVQDFGRGRPPRRRGRGWAALLVVLVCFGLLALAADRAAVILVERALGRGVQQQQKLAAPADVSIAGFPFLTQVLAGRYDRIDLAADGVPTGAGLTVDRITVRLTGVTASTSDLLAGRADRLGAARVAVRARVGYPALDAVVADRIAADRLRVRFSDGGGNRLAIAGTVHTALGDLQVKGLVKASLVKRGIRLQLVPGSVDGLPAAADRLLADLLDLTLATPDQVSGIRPTQIEVGPEGITLTGAGSDVPLGLLGS